MINTTTKDKQNFKRLHLKDGICNRFFCVYLVKRQIRRFKRVFVVWRVIYSTRQRKTTRTNGNKPNGKRFSFVGLPFWLCRVLQDDSERHFFRFSFLWYFNKLQPTKTRLHHRKRCTLFFMRSKTCFLFFGLSLYSRAGGKPVTRF